VSISSTKWIIRRQLFLRSSGLWDSVHINFSGHKHSLFTVGVKGQVGGFMISASGKMVHSCLEEYVLLSLGVNFWGDDDSGSF